MIVDRERMRAVAHRRGSAHERLPLDAEELVFVQECIDNWDDIVAETDNQENRSWLVCFVSRLLLNAKATP